MAYQTNIDLKQEGQKNEDVNLLAPNGFSLLIDRTTYKNVEYLVKTVSIPDISLPRANYAGAKRNIGFSGDTIEYSPLELTFLVDENLRNYREIHDWLLGQLNNEDYGATDGKTRDITLSILSSHNNVIQEIQFTSAYPTSLSTLEFDSGAETIEYLTASVTFEYSYYKIL